MLLFPSGLELPRINYDINGKRHQFVYGNYVGDSAEVVGTSDISDFLHFYKYNLSMETFNFQNRHLNFGEAGCSWTYCFTKLG